MADYFLETLDTAQSVRNTSSFVIDLRKSRRVETSLSASLTCERGQVAGTVANLSRGGLRFAAGQALADLLLAEFSETGEVAETVVEVRFDLPRVDAGPATVIAQARIVYLSQDAAEAYQCGVEFRTFAEGEDALREYLSERGAS